MENTSGRGRGAEVPTEIDRWNWGAFLLHGFWGVGNGTYIALLVILPFMILVMPFVLGAKGSAWAWRNRHWESVEEFQRIQRLWALWGVVLAVGFTVLIAGTCFGAVHAFRSSIAYRLGVERLEASADFERAIGRPYKAGVPTGEFSFGDAIGSAKMAFEVEGPRGRGEVNIGATKSGGAWTLDRVELREAATGRRIEVGP